MLHVQHTGNVFCLCAILLYINSRCIIFIYCVILYRLDVGIHTGQFVTTHGLAINCSTDLRWFEAIVPCGILNRGVTSLSRELDRTVPVAHASSVFLKSFAEAFRCSLIEKSTVEEALL